MPATSEKQRRFMGAELGRMRSGKRTRTGMSESQLDDYVHKTVSLAYGGSAKVGPSLTEADHGHRDALHATGSAASKRTRASDSRR